MGSDSGRRHRPSAGCGPAQGRNGADVVSTFDDTPQAVELEQLLRQVLIALLPDVAVETDGQVVRLRSIPQAKPVGGAVPVPVSLVALADAAATIREHFQRSAFGSPWGPH